MTGLTDQQLPQLLITHLAFWFSRFFLTTSMHAVTWDEDVITAINFLQHSVLQLPFFLMNLWKFLSPALDDMFMESLRWVDATYTRKHRSDDPTRLRAMFFDNLQHWTSDLPPKTKSRKRTPWDGIAEFLLRYGRKTAISLTLYLLSTVPYVGKFVLPVVSFYTFDRAVGPRPALVVFGAGLVLPKRYLILFLQTYFSSRSMMRELLEPYFSRVHFTREQKRLWFLDREGVLFGFGVGFFLAVKLPFVGFLIYAVAEASTAYLITKVTDPPPEPTPKETKDEYVQSQVRWKNKTSFMKLPIWKLDASNVDSTPAGLHPLEVQMPVKNFT